MKILLEEDTESCQEYILMIYLWFFVLFLSLVDSEDQLEHIFSTINSFPLLNLSAITSTYLFPLFQLDSNERTIFQCSPLFEDLKKEKTSLWPPPTSIPEFFYSAFTLENTIPVGTWYFSETTASTQTILTWNEASFSRYGNKECTCGAYQSPVCERAFRQYEYVISGRRGLVLGSLSPWAEIALIDHGAIEIVTVEYVPIENSHPRIRTMRPEDLAAEYLSNSQVVTSIDFIFSFSSIEHDGLGRYGDPINPFGDLETLARLHCLLPPGGYLFLGIPTGPIDALVWNAHRIYGKHRLRLIFQDWWEIVDFISVNPLHLQLNHTNSLSASYEEALWILRKKSPSRDVSVSFDADVEVT